MLFSINKNNTEDSLYICGFLAFVLITSTIGAWTNSYIQEQYNTGMAYCASGNIEGCTKSVNKVICNEDKHYMAHSFASAYKVKTGKTLLVSLRN